MTLAVWPAVSHEAMLGSYREKPERATIESFQVEDGPPLEGPSTSGTMSMDQVAFDLMLTKTEWGTLLAFYRDTLSNGTKYFTLANPATGTTETYKFLSEPEARSNNSVKYRVSIALRRFNY